MLYNKYYDCYCSDCKYYDKAKEHWEEYKFYYDAERYDIITGEYAWCKLHDNEAIPSYPAPYCDTFILNINNS